MSLNWNLIPCAVEVFRTATAAAADINLEILGRQQVVLEKQASNLLENRVLPGNPVTASIVQRELAPTRPC